MSSFHRTIYIGMTGDLLTRALQHKQGIVEGFTKKYKCHSLVFYEEYPSPSEAIEREKQLKKWSRKKKIRLIEDMNPAWEDLAKDWGDDYEKLEKFD